MHPMPIARRPIDPAAETFAQRVMDDASDTRLPDLFDARGVDPIYHVPDRNGISTIVVPTSALNEDQLHAVLRFRLAQYLAVGFADPQIVYGHRMEYEPFDNVAEDDLHFLAGSPATGQILCYATLKSIKNPQAGATLRTPGRAQFPVEVVHGHGIYTRLRLLPDLPIAKVRELGRFVKNQRVPCHDELGARAPVEVGVALFRALAGSLRLEVEAIVGDFEEGIARQNLEYFHAPMAVIHGTIPYEPEASWFCPRYQHASVYPFAVLSADCSAAMLSRLAAVEHALSVPGKPGLLRLFKLKREVSLQRSSLIPDANIAPMVETITPQIGVAMRTRREMLDAADRLREIEPLQALSTAEAVLLNAMLEPCEAQPGDVIVRQGDVIDDVYLIESGHAELRVNGRSAASALLVRLGPGDYFGEEALLTGAECMVDVIAATPMTLHRLTKETWSRYLAHIPEVELHLTRTALKRSCEAVRIQRFIESDLAGLPSASGRAFHGMPQVVRQLPNTLEPVTERSLNNLEHSCR